MLHYLPLVITGQKGFANLFFCVVSKTKISCLFSEVKPSNKNLFINLSFLINIKGQFLSDPLTTLCIWPDLDPLGDKTMIRPIPVDKSHSLFDDLSISIKETQYTITKQSWFINTTKMFGLSLLIITRRAVVVYSLLKTKT